LDLKMRGSQAKTTARQTLLGLGRPAAGETVVVGLSGGADSVCLTDILVDLGRELGFAVVAAHLDHALRPGSAADAEFCRQLCRRLNVRLVSARSEVRRRAESERTGLEETARDERYAFLRRVRFDQDASVIAVAHTEDDQAETLLLRLLRGAGSPGLSCMRPAMGELLRPLLRVSRRDVLAHLEGRGLPWREDPSNSDLAFARNRVRHELIPYLESRFNPRARQALARTAGLLADEAVGQEHLADALLQQAAGRPGELRGKALAAAPRAIARLAVRRSLERSGGLLGVTAWHVDRLLDLALAPDSSGRRLSLPGRREAVVRFGSVHIGPRLGPPPPPYELPLPVPGRVEVPGGVAVSAEPCPGPAVSKGRSVAVVAVPEAPLTVRTRRPGDRVRTHGREMSLKRFLMGRRVPAELRAGLPMVACGRRVLWIPGQAMQGCGEASRRFVRLEVLEPARS
jgi:tRNA(Ile)-lysidine synthase